MTLREKPRKNDSDTQKMRKRQTQIETNVEGHTERCTGFTSTNY